MPLRPNPHRRTCRELQPLILPVAAPHRCRSLCRHRTLDETPPLTSSLRDPRLSSDPASDGCGPFLRRPPLTSLSPCKPRACAPTPATSYRPPALMMPPVADIRRRLPYPIRSHPEQEGARTVRRRVSARRARNLRRQHHRRKTTSTADETLAAPGRRRPPLDRTRTAPAGV